MRDVTEYIGVPFKYGGRGPDFYDCYGLVMTLLEEDGKQVPDYRSPSEAPEIIAMFESAIPTWNQLPHPLVGSVLVFRVMGNLHCGYYIGADRFVHAWEGSNGVCVERLSLWYRRLVGAYEYIA